MTTQGKQRQVVSDRGVLRISLVTLATILIANAVAASGLQHRFDILATRVRAQLGSRATVTECRPDGHGFVVSLAGISAGQLRRVFRNWQPDPLLASVQISEDRAAGKTTLVLGLGASVPGAAVRAAVRRQALEIVARLTAPATSAYYTDAGVYLAQQGRRREALAQFRKAIALQPGNARAYLEAAKVRAALGERSLAIFNAKKAQQNERTRSEALALLAQLDPSRWGEKVRSKAPEPERFTPQSVTSSLSSETERQNPSSGATGVRKQGSRSDSGAAAPTTGATEKARSADKPGRGNALGSNATLAKPSGDVRTATQTKETDIVDPFSTPSNAWAFLLAFAVAALFTAPLTWFLVRASRRSAEAVRGPFVRVPANTPPLDDFQRLLVERSGALDAEPVQDREGKERGEPEVDSVLKVVEEIQRRGPESPLGAPEQERHPGNILETAELGRPQRDIRVELESVLALAGRGLPSEEIARRIGMGREEVRLILAMSRSQSRRPVWTRAGEPGLTLTFVE